MRTSNKYTLAVCLALMLVANVRAQAADSATQEKELIAVLKSEAPAAEKAITCKKLAIVGSAAAVSELARLLPDPQLSSWSRIALEAIPGPEANEALRNAAYSLEGKLLIGTINSIGVRRDESAVDLLTTRLQDRDAEVASAAAAALGQIGNAAAVKSLRQALTAAPDKVRSAVADGCVVSAEQLHAAGKSAEAATIYDEVRKADVPKQRILEATRGAILARSSADGIQLLTEQLRSPDKAMFQLALGTAREFPGSEVDKALAAEVAKATPERAALVITAMADRKQTVVLSAVLSAAEQGPPAVRLAAISALGRVGNGTCLNSLLKVALESEKGLQQAAKAAIADLPDAKVDEQVVTLLASAQGATYPLLIEVVGKRRIEASSTLNKALDHADPAVRSAAMLALGETVDLAGMAQLVTQAVAPKHPEDAAVARQALKAAAIRMPDREACATELVAAMDKSSSMATKITLLETLGSMGGQKALATMSTSAKSGTPELQDASTKLLGEWMTADAAPVLLDLVKTAPGDKYQGRAIKGYIRIARQFVMPDVQRVDMCQKAMDASRNATEKKLVLEVLKRYPSKGSLKLAIDARQSADLKADATEAAQAIAQKLAAKGVDVKDMLSKAGL